MKQIGGVGLPESLQQQDDGQGSATLSETELLDSGDQTVEQLGTGAGDVTLQGRLTPEVPRPQMTVRELRELNSGTKGPVAFFRAGGADANRELDDAGFYELADATVETISPNVPDVFNYTVELTRAGTRGDSFRAVAVNALTETHPFGGGTDAHIGLPDTVDTTLWLDGSTRETTVATPANTAASSRGTVERYLLSDAPSGFDPLKLVYDVPYPQDVRGVRVFDSRSNAEKYDSNNVRQWQSVNHSKHDIDNAIILSNGRFRLRVRERNDGTPVIEDAERGGGEWGPFVDYTPNGYDPLDVDLIDIDQQRVEIQILFVRSTGTSTYAVNLSLTLGYDTPLVYPAPSESTGIPTEIDSALSNFARPSEKRTQATRTLVSREAVRR